MEKRCKNCGNLLSKKQEHYCCVICKQEDQKGKQSYKVQLDLDEIKRLYLKEKFTANEIAEKMGSTKRVILRRLKDMEITRSKGESKSLYLCTHPENNPNNMPGVKEKQRAVQIELNKDPEYLKERILARKKGLDNMTIEEKKAWALNVSKARLNMTPEQKYKMMKKQTDTKRKNGTLNCSGLEDKYAQKLDDEGIEYIREYILPEGNRRYRYDFYLSESKLLIEIQGNGTHANPEKYKADDVVKLGLKNWKVKTAAEIWEYDRKKGMYAEESGYDVEYVWENELL